MQLINKRKLSSFLIPFLIFTLIIFLRFFALSKSPPSPYWEEVALGYDAYSISQTARDHHGNFLPLVAFESFGDYKPSLYFYVAAVSVKIFGLNVFAVRLPTILASIAIIFGIAFLSRLLFRHFYLKGNGQAEEKIFYISLFLATISPWLLTFSRSAWESTLATALILWGVNFWLLFNSNDKLKWAILTVLFLGLSTYTYHSARITAPLLGLFLVIFYLKKKMNFKALLAAGVVAILVFAPIAKSLFEKSGGQRIAETSILSDVSVIEKSNKLKTTYNNSPISKIIYHRYVLFGEQIVVNFFSHFNFKYLFVSGDINPRHSIQTFGEFYYFDLLFFVFAIIFLLRRKSRATHLLLFYLFVAILPAAFTKATPHALRTLAALPVFIVLLSFGVWQFLEIIHNQKYKNFAMILIIIVYLLFIVAFFYQLIFVYPNNYKNEWQFGYQELMNKISSVKNNYEKVYVSRKQGRPAMYYFFYNQIDPKLVQAANTAAKKDQGEFLSFENIEFIDSKDQIDPNKKSLFFDFNNNGSWTFYETK